MTQDVTPSDQILEKHHQDILEWNSSLQFIEGEILFIHQLLNSYIYEPNTLNLFERLQTFKNEMTLINEVMSTLKLHIKKHEGEIAGILQCDTISCDLFYQKKHESLVKEYNSFYKNFKVFKSKVFTYAGGILKKNKK